MLSLGLTLWTQHRRASSEPAAPVINSVTITGTPAVGATLSAAVSRTGYPAPTLAYQWKNEGTNISGATGATYVVQAGDSGDDITVAVDATNSEGSDSATSAAVTIVPAPVAAGGLSDQVCELGQAITALNVAADFTGGSITYALAPSSAALPAGLVLSVAGLLTGLPTVLAAGLSIIVRGTNAGGYDDTAFSLTVADAPGQMSAPSVTASGASGISVDRASAPAANNSAITSYDLRHSTDQSSWTTVTDISDPEAVGSLTQDTTYYVQTRAVNSIGAGAWSASGSATTEEADTAPAQMAAPTFADVEYETATVNRGTAPSNGGSAITSYQMRWRETGGTWATVDPFGATADLTGLDNDTEYEAQQRATNAIGSGAWSSSGTFTTEELPDIEGNSGGTVDIALDEDEGTFSITISGSTHSHQNGTIGPFDIADLDDGPICVVPALISGTAGTGNVLTAIPGIWAWPGGTVVQTVAGQWQRDDTNISGETGLTYTTVGADEGETVEYQETATSDDGATVRDSNGIAIPVSGGWSITDNEDGTFDIDSAPTAPAALTITDNEDGTFDAEAA